MYQVQFDKVETIIHGIIVIATFYYISAAYMDNLLSQVSLKTVSPLYIYAPAIEIE